MLVVNLVSFFYFLNQNKILFRVKLVILESVLEGNDDNNILRKIIKAIPVDCIKWNLGIIYEKYRFIGNK